MKWGNLKFWKSDTWKRLANVDGLPRTEVRYRAFDLCPFDRVEFVILGQDPYPRKGMADGLCFSVQPHIKPLPHSLRNIFKELVDDVGVKYPSTGSLIPWTERGGLLLNTILTVEEGKPLSHKHIGWERLTYEVVSELSRRRDGIVWMLWGKQAQAFTGAIDSDRHCVLSAAHPSPLARDMFFGSRPFSKCNEYRSSVGKQPIDWRLP